MSTDECAPRIVVHYYRECCIVDRPPYRFQTIGTTIDHHPISDHIAIQATSFESANITQATREQWDYPQQMPSSTFAITWRLYDAVAFGALFVTKQPHSAKDQRRQCQNDYPANRSPRDPNKSTHYFNQQPDRIGRRSKCTCFISPPQ